MKIYSFIVLMLCLFCVAHTCEDDECDADWECGNPVYFDCQAQQECTLLPGLDTAPGQVFWLERCRAEGESTAVYVVRADESGVQRVITVPEETNDDAGNTTAVRLAGANIDTVYVAKDLPVYAAVTGFSVVGDGYSNEFRVFSPRSPFDFKMAFDEVNERTFACWHPYYGVIIRYDTLNVSSTLPPTTTYKSITCSAIAYGNNSIFWAQVVLSQGVYSTRIYRGDPLCNDCSPPSIFATAPGSFYDFEVYNGRIYYSAQNEGIKSVDLVAPDWSNPQVLVAGGNATSLSVRDGRVYYNDGSAIKVININGSNPATLSASHSSKRCVCSGGFSGVDCDECPNGQTQWNNGRASCVPINALGWPETCGADYMCGSMPYARCNAQRQCECVTGGIPPLCDSCPNGGEITWNNHIPSCPAS